ncbi:YesL family protein [Lactobacillus hominis]|uniref:Predicted membrane protein n=1 Tax=Lactobacillus hominis DSM 23910 = CRBIP 24.179 TaxID=1423758 RepID=I7JVB4_9LACO|nr:DUF624 domain-containing protein [Lactobacillus hominis]KRM85179.1 hypothetical protein FC41_GL001559 [Lactobacillus hominis DSM 23910 = CRBIP 24.179]MCT3348340.1 DUF624 domain-containing protein [Lactobacillus hominis]CCI82541.1 Predicted membrane protein [Lactobacillus hominis DSM 23910 = CRBIP 24.179]
MLGRMTQRAFVAIYVLMILNLAFWLFSLIGLFILGIGPALRTITEVFLNHKFEYHNYHFKEMWQIYKKYFWIANGHFYSFFGIELFLFYDLYLTSQIKNMWMLPVIFLLVFVMITLTVVGIYTLIIESTFDVEFKNAVKLAFVAFFSDFKDLLKFIAGLVVIGALTKFWPGFLLFLTVSTIIVWGAFSSKKWIGAIIDQLEAD